MTKRSYSFPIFSPVQKINFPDPISKCFAVRVNQMTFKFQDFNRKVLLLSLPSLDTNTYYDGVISEKCTFIFFNDGSKSTINYFNNLPSYDATFSARNMECLHIVVKIDGILDNIISPENPLYISLDFYSNS